MVAKLFTSRILMISYDIDAVAEDSFTEEVVDMGLGH
jgi:hypothetical protein